jgi:hypothetical protein
VLAQKLNLELISPPDDLLLHLSPKWLGRNIGICTLVEAKNLTYPTFIKPLTPKIFNARKYNSYDELLDECTQLEQDTHVIHSDIVNIRAEVRSFILNSRVCSMSLYEGKADISEAEVFLNRFVNENSKSLPVTCVLDVGFIDGFGWVVIEANASWGAGLNGCDPLAAAMCISKASQ